MKVNVFPKVCNICGGKVEYISTHKIFGRFLKYGEKSGFCYHCKECGAIVGTHADRPLEAYGLLANKEMRKMRQRNHDMFDKFWKNKQQRTKMYRKLAAEMDIPEEECHFGYFTEEELEKSYQIMLKWWRDKYDR